ncbi:hypothetical protein GCM10028807_17620 [Spirosoma daeguense]
MQTEIITLEKYLNTFPEPEQWFFSSPGVKQQPKPECNMIPTLYHNCNVKGPEINITRVCYNVVNKAQKRLLKQPYSIIHVAAKIIQKGDRLTYVDCFELVMWHMVERLNERYKWEKIPLQLELGEREKERAGLTD